jgi:hypothetical protein
VRAPVGREAAAAVARRPDLWPTAVVVGLRMAGPGWWRQWPPRPLPPDDYTRFRLHTMYGAAGDGRLGGDDTVRYLEWCRRHGGRRR